METAMLMLFRAEGLKSGMKEWARRWKARYRLGLGFL